jgi:hypothetical protein
MDPENSMRSIPLDHLIPVLQVAIGPVILISGIGLLLLSMTNRLGRAVDRARQLAGELRTAAGDDQGRLSAQVNLLFSRARLIRLGIALVGLSALLAAFLIITLFLSVLLSAEAGLLIILLFICCMAALIGGLAAFIVDIYWSLGALKAELEL